MIDQVMTWVNMFDEEPAEVVAAGSIDICLRSGCTFILDEAYEIISNAKITFEGQKATGSLALNQERKVIMMAGCRSRNWNSFLRRHFAGVSIQENGRVQEVGIETRKLQYTTVANEDEKALKVILKQHVASLAATSPVILFGLSE